MKVIAEQCQFKEMRERYTLAMMGGSSYRDGVQYGFMRKGKITVNLHSMIIYNYVLHLLKVSDCHGPVLRPLVRSGLRYLLLQTSLKIYSSNFDYSSWRRSCHEQRKDFSEELYSSENSGCHGSQSKKLKKSSCLKPFVNIRGMDIIFGGICTYTE